MFFLKVADMRLFLLVFLFVFSLSACGPTSVPGGVTSAVPATARPAAAESGSSQVDLPPVEAQSIAEGEAQAVDSLAPMVVATAIPTRPLPEDFDWREAPILPDISDRVLEIFQNGLAQGRDPTRFSVVGDCQGIPFVFMGPIGRRELLPGGNEQYLWNSIRYFEASMNRESITVRGGFTAASLMNPMQADPRQCKPGETPLTCEYRLHNPAFLFITLENWRNPDTIDRYEAYLRDIIEYAIARGSVPILLTKADASEVPERIHIINPAVARLAYEYDLPLVNFWRAAQNLPNRGIDPEREGFHLSQQGYDLKNLLALRALHQVSQKIETDSAQLTAAPTPEVAAEPQETTTVRPEINVLAEPNCAGGCVFLGLAQSQDGEIESLGVFAYEYDRQNLRQFLPAGFDLQDVHPDGRRLLVNQQNLLYALNLDDFSSELLSESFYWQGERGAYWAGSGPDAPVVLIDANQPYQGGQGQATRLFVSRNEQVVFFDSGSCQGKDYCESEGIYYQFAGQPAERFEDIIRPAFSPAGSWYAFINPEALTPENFGKVRYFAVQNFEEGILSRKVIYLPARRGFRVFPDVRALAFSPQSDKLFIYYDIYSAYFEKSLRFETYLLDLKTGILNEYGDMLGNSGSLNPKMVWSPDGSQVLFFLTELDAEERYSLGIYRTVLGTEERLRPFHSAVYRDDDYFYITNIAWASP